MADSDPKPLEDLEETIDDARELASEPTPPWEALPEGAKTVTSDGEDDVEPVTGA